MRGGLWNISHGKLFRFRCNVGHAYSGQTLAYEQGNTVERALWAALRAMEERTNVLSRMEEIERDHGRMQSASSYAEEIAALRHHAIVIRGLLVGKEKKGS